jgi:plasmid stabilization system protein ParE
MEKRKRVLLSSDFENDIQGIFEYGFLTFGYTTAELYKKHIMLLVYQLADFYLIYPECRHLATKNQIYRKYYTSLSLNYL